MICVLCEVVEANSRHHLIPKRQKNADKVTEGFCRSCHDMVHATISNKVLGKNYNTVEKLKAHPKIAAWIKWRQTHPGVLPKVRQAKSKYHSRYREPMPIDNRMNTLLSGVFLG